MREDWNLQYQWLHSLFTDPLSIERACKQIIYGGGFIDRQRKGVGEEESFFFFLALPDVFEKNEKKNKTTAGGTG